MITIDLFTELKKVDSTGERVYANKAPAGVETPYLVYTQVSNVRSYTHNGFSGLSTSRFQVSCYADSYGAAKTAAEEVTSTLEAWTDAIAFQANEVDLYEDDTGLYHIAVDFFIRH